MGMVSSPRVDNGLTLKDFLPGKWVENIGTPKWDCCDEHEYVPKHVKDNTTNRFFLNESNGLNRFKCVVLFLGTPFVHSVAGVMNVAYRQLKLITLSHFWMPREGKCYHFQARLLDAGKDLLRIGTQPIIVVALQVASIYGVFRPNDGRKLYSSIEKAQYGEFLVSRLVNFAPVAISRP